MRPVCGACALRSSPCSFPIPSRPLCTQRRGEFKGSKRAQRADDAGPQAANSVNRESSNSRGMQQHPVTGYPLQPLEFTVLGSSTGLESTRPHSLNTSDLRLLQHFLTRTSDKMSFDPKRSLVWQHVIPDLAGKKEYLMHLLLALAGAHLISQMGLSLKEDNDADSSHLRKGDLADLHLVIEHHQEGLQGFREALSTMSAATAETVFCGSILLVAFAFASLRIRGMDDLKSSPMYSDTDEYPRLDWLHLIRGLTSVVGQHWLTLKTGRLRSLLLYPYANDDWKPIPPSSSSIFPRLVHCSHRLNKFSRGVSEALSNFRTFTHQLQQESEAGCDDITTALSQHSSSAFLDSTDLIREQIIAIEKLEETYMRILYVLQFTESEQGYPPRLDVQADLEAAAVMSWPHHMSNAFIVSLGSINDVGLAEAISYTILAHFYLIFILFEDLWYFEGVFEKEIVKINGLVEGLENGQLSALMWFPMDIIADR